MMWAEVVWLMVGVAFVIAQSWWHARSVKRRKSGVFTKFERWGIGLGNRLFGRGEKRAAIEKWLRDYPDEEIIDEPTPARMIGRPIWSSPWSRTVELQELAACVGRDLHR